MPAGAACVAPLHVPTGHAALAAGWARGQPPTPLQIEQAIEQVEDLVMPARARLPARLQLATHDLALHALARAGAHAADAQVAKTLGIETVEQLFNRLVARAAGRPASQDALRVDGPHAARLIIVRELLHHWGLDGIVLLA